MKYYSPSQRGFYDKDIHNTIPDDCVELSDDDHQTIMNKQSEGFVIAFKDGKVVCEDQFHSEEDRAAMYRSFRRAAYPSVQEQLDMLWHAMNDGIMPGKDSEWFKTISDIKEMNPKSY